MATNGKRNKRAGHSYEQATVRLLVSRGIYPHAVTARSANRRKDSQKIDIVNISELEHGEMSDSIQTKNCCGTINYLEILKSMPRKKGIRNVVFHKRTRRAEQLFVPVGEFAFTSAEDYVELMAYWRAFELVRKYVDWDKLPKDIREHLLKLQVGAM